MKSASANGNLSYVFWIGCTVAWAYLCASVLLSAQESTRTRVPAAPVNSAASARRFDTPQQAADALINAAGKFDVMELLQIFGPGGEDIVLSGEVPQDRRHAADFAAEAHEKNSVSLTHGERSKPGGRITTNNAPTVR